MTFKRRLKGVLVVIIVKKWLINSMDKELLNTLAAEVDRYDYKQLTIWADNLGCSVNQFIALQDQRFSKGILAPYPWIKDGRIIQIDVRKMNITQLDLSHCPEIETIFCGDNKLRELDLSRTPKLEYLNCDWSSLRKVDLTHVPNLTNFWCNNGQLTELDLSYSSKLNSLCCGHNSLKTLDLSACSNLEMLYLRGNKFTSIDISCCPKLSFSMFEKHISVTKRPDQRLKEFRV